MTQRKRLLNVLKKQKRYYFGKQKRHTLKTQLLVSLQTGEIIALAFSNGKRHDIQLFKCSCKIDMAVQLLDDLPEPEVPVIALMDSWYTCQRLWDKTMGTGALKSNRILYPDGKRYSANEYALSLPNGQYHLVKVAVTSTGSTATWGRSMESATR